MLSALWGESTWSALLQPLLQEHFLIEVRRRCALTALPTPPLLAIPACIMVTAEHHDEPVVYVSAKKKLGEKKKSSDNLS